MVSCAGNWKPRQQSSIAVSGSSSCGGGPSAAKSARRDVWAPPPWAGAYSASCDDNADDADADYRGEDISCNVPDVDLVIPEVYRYHSDGCWDDYGWGCVYRNTQTILRTMGAKVPALPDMTKAMGTGDSWTQTPGQGCGWIEPHDVAEYLRMHVKDCPDMRLLNVATRDGATLVLEKTCKVGTRHVYELWEREPNLERGSPGAKRAVARIRELIVMHMARSRLPVLLDDTMNAYLVAGFRAKGPSGGAEYRILDPHYGMRYSQRQLGFWFNPAWGADQYGSDEEKDQWVSAAWVEESTGFLNGYRPGPMWMILLVGCY